MHMRSGTGEKMRPILIALALASVGTAAAAGPFGLEMGTPTSKLRVIGRADKPDTYQVAPPTPDAEFSAYVVVASSKQGLCKIVAFGKDHENDADGTAIRAAFEHVKATLAKQYGSSGDFDFVDFGSPWSKGGDFAMSLRENHRSLASFWDSSEESTLPGDITNIKLEAKATSSTTTYVTVTYEFANFGQCNGETVRTQNGRAL